MLFVRLLVGLLIGLSSVAPAQANEQVVRMAFRDTPILIKIARCESGFRQFDEDGTVLKGKVNPDDTGVMQINKHYHESDAKELGLNLDNIHDNMAYARYLYKKRGTRPWKASKKCWSRSA